METYGGLYGGAARGLAEGLALGNQAAEQQIQGQRFQQEMGLRQQEQQQRSHEFQQEFGLQQQSQNRLDKQQEMGMYGKKAEAANKAADALEQQAFAVHQQHNGLPSDEENLLKQQAQEARKAGVGYLTRQWGPTIIDKTDTANQDADALAKNKVTPEQLGPERYANVHALTGHAIDDYIIDPDYGTNKITRHVQAFNNKMSIGDLQGAHEAAGPLVSNTMSIHPPEHPDHVPGVPDIYGSGSDDHIQNGMHIAGAKGTMAAATSDPASQKLLQQAADIPGFVESQKHAIALVGANNGVPGMKKALQEFDQSLHEANQHIANGKSPDEAINAVAQKTFSEQTADAAAYYANTFGHVPGGFKVDEKEVARQNYVKANRALHPDWTEAQANAEAVQQAYDPQGYARRQEIAADAPLKNAQAAEARAGAGLKGAQAGWFARRQQSGETIFGTDGKQYAKDGNFYYDIDGNLAPQGVIPVPKNGPRTDVEGRIQAQALSEAKAQAAAMQRQNPNAQVDVESLRQQAYQRIKASIATQGGQPAASGPVVADPNSYFENLTKGH